MTSRVTVSRPHEVEYPAGAGGSVALVDPHLSPIITVGHTPAALTGLLSGTLSLAE